MNVTKSPFTFSQESKTKVLEKISEENIFKIYNADEMLEKTISYTFPALPNRRHDIALTYYLKSGKSGVIIPVGECSNPPEGILRLILIINFKLFCFFSAIICA